MTKIEEDMVRERIVRRGIHMSKVIMVVFDGLQPSQVSEELTPNIHGVASKGCFFEDHHCVFPSVTRANVATLMTGTHPGVHGLLGNNFIDVTYDPTRVISASNTEFDHMNKYDHEILNAKTMYQILQEFNMSYMAVGVGTTGNAYLHHVGGGDSDSNSGTIHPEFSNPSFLSEDILVKFGPWPEEEVPNNVRFSHAMDIFIEYILGEKNPEVALIWSSEPDKSQHAYGVGHHLSNSALEHADKEFGRLLEKLGSNFTDSNTLMILSDHGYSTIEEVIEVEKIIINAGFRIGTGKGELLLALNGGSALISVGGSDVDTADRLVSWLMKQKWCGNILAGDRIGPIDGDDHVGGNYAMALGFEAALPNLLPEDWRTDVSLFIDTANLWGVDYDKSIGDSDKIRSSTGASASVFTPIGPLSLTLAHPITKAASDQTESFTFRLGTSF